LEDGVDGGRGDGGAGPRVGGSDRHQRDARLRVVPGLSGNAAASGAVDGQGPGRQRRALVHRHCGCHRGRGRSCHPASSAAGCGAVCGRPGIAVRRAASQCRRLRAVAAAGVASVSRRAAMVAARGRRLDLDLRLACGRRADRVRRLRRRARGDFCRRCGAPEP